MGVARAQLHAAGEQVVAHAVGHAPQHLRTAGVVEEHPVAREGGKLGAEAVQGGGELGRLVIERVALTAINPATGQVWQLNTDANNKNPAKQTEASIRGDIVVNQLSISTLPTTTQPKDRP